MTVSVSVVIPVYNVALWLRRCLDSVCGQTFVDIEIICVDDCSTDGSRVILEEYAARDARIRILRHEKNSGLAAARNTGAAAARGKYIYFLDSDDWIDLDYLEKMYAAAERLKLDAVCNTNVLCVDTNGTVTKFLKRDFAEGWKDYSASCVMPWTWLLKKEFLDRFDVLFPEGLTQEDCFFFYVIIRSLGKVYIINSSSYYHFENPQSIMGRARGRVMKGFDSIRVIVLIYEYYKKNNLLDRYSIPFFYLPKYCLNRHSDKQAYFRELRIFYAEIEKDVLWRKELYADFEIAFLEEVLAHKDYNGYRRLDTSIIGALRQGVKKYAGSC